GSRVAEANDALHAIAAMVREQKPGTVVEVAFREMHAPNIQLGIDRCVDQGAKHILLYPYFLYSGAHVLEDLPEEIDAARQRHEGLQMVLGEPLGVHPKLAEVVCERVDEKLNETGWNN
ncbi:MAG: sirohydrochlorin cobaltochelatase, partial [Desulfuromonas sp.]